MKHPKDALPRPRQSGEATDHNVCLCLYAAQDCCGSTSSFAKRVPSTMTKTRCTDRIVGAILASWRYDISGIFPEMRKDYEQHFAECSHCCKRQKFHRGLDVSLFVLTALSALFALRAGRALACQALRACSLQCLRPGYCRCLPYAHLGSHRRSHFSVVAFLLVLTATPAPTYLGGIAIERAKLIEERLPAAIKSLRPRLTLAEIGIGGAVPCPPPTHTGQAVRVRRFKNSYH